MRRLIPLMMLTLAACSSPLEELYPVKRFTFKQDERTYDVRAQYDPLQRGWFTQTSLRHGRLERTDSIAVQRLVEGTLGPQVCDGQRLEVKPGMVWSGHDQHKVRYLPVNGTWHLVGSCTG